MLGLVAGLAELCERCSLKSSRRRRASAQVVGCCFEGFGDSSGCPSNVNPGSKQNPEVDVDWGGVPLLVGIQTTFGGNNPLIMGRVY